MSVVESGSVSAAPKPMTPFQEFWHYFRRNKGAVVGLIFITLMLLMAVFAGVLAPHQPTEQFRDALLHPPVWQQGEDGVLFSGLMMLAAIFSAG